MRLGSILPKAVTTMAQVHSITTQIRAPGLVILQIGNLCIVNW